MREHSKRYQHQLPLPWQNYATHGPPSVTRFINNSNQRGLLLPRLDVYSLQRPLVDNGYDVINLSGLLHHIDKRKDDIELGHWTLLPRQAPTAHFNTVPHCAPSTASHFLPEYKHAAERWDKCDHFAPPPTPRCLMHHIRTLSLC